MAEDGRPLEGSGPSALASTLAHEPSPVVRKRGRRPLKPGLSEAERKLERSMKNRLSAKRSRMREKEREREVNVRLNAAKEEMKGLEQDVRGLRERLFILERQLMACPPGSVGASSLVPTSPETNPSFPGSMLWTCCPSWSPSSSDGSCPSASPTPSAETTSEVTHQLLHINTGGSPYTPLCRPGSYPAPSSPSTTTTVPPSPSIQPHVVLIPSCRPRFSVYYVV
eukprot:CAMPEP_0184684768 /NCGR_PEP_ID=MMETSP0312-20130426/16654_1 /TAXON_ID=31354 /ORGANISM="Compsopogon coeruleus, Strain SAG 36.94" /LENGTH=224 /DNA_ID=CAMNT_0027138305 /DNA_START=219 /DNA_END=893 /DNA_ORIENTATION=+